MRCRGDFSNRFKHEAAGLLAAGAVAVAALPAAGQAFQQYGLNFVTVGDPGNRAATAQEAPLWPTFAEPLGAVDHTIGIMRTNVTNNEWIDFVRAYAPYYPDGPGNSDLTGEGVKYTGMVGGLPQYEVRTGHGRASADMTWRIAARFANWLHNDKQSIATAFEDGAYDTSTFGETVVGGFTVLTDQVTHHPDGKFWIPTVHEYTKAGHWDPNKNGPGQGGYWLMPDGGDENLIAGPPGIGECAGDWWTGFFIDVELYPDTPSPWGVLDISSTYWQHTEGYIHPATGTRRLTAGSSPSSGYWVDDRLDNFATALPHANFAIRLASAVPSPASVVGLGLAVTLLWKRRRASWDGTGVGTFSP